MEGLESMTPLESEKKDLMARLGEIYYKKCKESGNVTAEEAEILEKINATGVGPQGLGGAVTSLAVHIEFFPCHIASLPVAINVNCHAARHAEVEL